MENIINAIKEAISSAFESARASFLDGVIIWLYEKITDGFQYAIEWLSGMGVEMFELGWVKSTLSFFSSFGWMMFISGCAMAVFSNVITYLDCGRISFKRNILPILEGLLATALFTVIPVVLYKACTNLQTTFISDLTKEYLNTDLSLINAANNALGYIAIRHVGKSIIALLLLIVVIFCLGKVFFANIKRGGILLIQIAVGSLHLFSLPRGISEGFTSWCKQVVALCFTAFLQTSLLYMGLITFVDYPMVGIGVMLSACEVPRITKMFGLETGVNISPAIGKATSIINLGRSVLR